MYSKYPAQTFTVIRGLSPLIVKIPEMKCFIKHGAYRYRPQNPTASRSNVLASERSRHTLTPQEFSCFSTGEHNPSTYRSASSWMVLLHSRTAVSIGFCYRHQEREIMTSPPQIPFLEFSVLAFPLPFPDLLSLPLSPSPPLSLPSVSPRLVQDEGRIVFARVGRGVTVVSVHRRFHAVAIGQDRRARAGEALTGGGFLGDATNN